MEKISIHAPLRGRPAGRGRRTYRRPDFNPRPLAGATCRIPNVALLRGISIHAPLRGRPAGRGRRTYRRPDFNPRPLAGATGRCTFLLSTH